MIERVTKAIYLASLRHPNAEWMQEPAIVRDHFRKLARAAVESMREPTKAMCDAVWRTASDEDCDDHWRGMIDAALAEEPA
jgi:hypothetical protein